MFEYKVRARHKLGWKEFKLYADTDIEEFFNRRSIEYVRNMTDTIENKQQQEIERLDNIIKRLEEFIEKETEIYTLELTEKNTNALSYSLPIKAVYKEIYNVLQELKGDGSNE